MISLKRHMDQQREQALTSALACCRGLVAVMASSGARACPSLAESFQHNLMLLREQLSLATEAGTVTETGQQIEREVDGWGTRASEYYRQKAAEIREIMLAMMEAAKAVSQRDQHYRAQFNEVSERIQTIGNLEDLTQIRHLVNQTASELRGCAGHMVEDGEQSVTDLRAQLVSYEQRLAEAERLSETDPLTGLANRAGVEHALETRIRAARSFSLLIADLDGFKALNDRYGHLAGDELLKAFAVEFRAQFRSFDVIGRWGGDEFVVLIEADPAEIQTCIQRVRNWALGEYTIHVSGKPQKIRLAAAIGTAAWRPGMTVEQVFSQADRAMYADKDQAKRAVGPAACPPASLC